MDKKPIYSAVVLTEHSRTECMIKLGHELSNINNWALHAPLLLHHCTICMGGIENCKYTANNAFLLKVDGIGWLDGFSAIAFRVSNINRPDGKQSHITICVNTNGYTAKDANKITNWRSMKSFWVMGYIKEIYN